MGFIGTGMIRNTHLEKLSRFPDVDVVILGDLNVDVAGLGPSSTASPRGALPTTYSATRTSKS